MINHSSIFANKTPKRGHKESDTTESIFSMLRNCAIVLGTLRPGALKNAICGSRNKLAA